MNVAPQSGRLSSEHISGMQTYCKVSACVRACEEINVLLELLNTG